ncbi:hypothetical protein [Aquimarina rhabdastrellae]
MNFINLFKKRQDNIAQEPQFEQDIILGIPGKWDSIDAIKASIIEHSNNELTIKDNFITDSQTGQVYELDIYDYDPQMWLAFKKWSKTPLDENFLDELDTHTHTIYLVGPGGSMSLAQRISEIAVHILNAGGFGVKIETSGTAYDKSNWTTTVGINAPIALYSLYVRQMQYARTSFSYTCGMHNLGLADVSTRQTDLQIAIPAVLQFNSDRLMDNLTIKAGDQYTALDTDFLITEETTCPTADDEYYRNPWGMWLLTAK